MKTKPVLALLAVMAVVSVALAGCTSTPAGDRPTPTPRELAPVIFSGSVSGEKDILPPAGAHSATITVVCGGQGFFTLSGALNPDVDGLDGSCGGGSHRYQMIVGPLRKLHLEIELTKGGGFVVETRFSSDHLVADPELAAQCSTIVTVGSDVFNAEDGFTRGALSLAQWNQKISDAASALHSLASDKTNILSATVATIRGTLTSTNLAPGAFEGSAATDYNGAISIVSQVCSENGTPIYVNAAYGG